MLCAACQVSRQLELLRVCRSARNHCDLHASNPLTRLACSGASAPFRARLTRHRVASSARPKQAPPAQAISQSRSGGSRSRRGSNLEAMRLAPAFGRWRSSSARPTAAALLLLLCSLSPALVSARAIRGSSEASSVASDAAAPADVTADAAVGRQLLAPALDSGSPDIGTRIVGGTTVSPTRYPYLASLRSASGSHFCGGEWCSARSPRNKEKAPRLPRCDSSTPAALPLSWRRRAHPPACGPDGCACEACRLLPRRWVAGRRRELPSRRLWCSTLCAAHPPTLPPTHPPTHAVRVRCRQPAAWHPPGAPVHVCGHQRL